MRGRKRGQPSEKPCQPTVPLPLICLGEFVGPAVELRGREARPATSEKPWSISMFFLPEDTSLGVHVDWCANNIAHVLHCSLLQMRLIDSSAWRSWSRPVQLPRFVLLPGPPEWYCVTGPTFRKWAPHFCSIWDFPPYVSSGFV